ncbi:hypothetical protein BC830DRAFT_1133280 [Chytriomyces sp. MP71]|nr:hypothetical protein BC830DRAFT_1133280 [Chytriomyces sp. MP71]
MHPVDFSTTDQPNSHIRHSREPICEALPYFRRLFFADSQTDILDRTALQKARKQPIRPKVLKDNLSRRWRLSGERPRIRPQMSKSFGSIRAIRRQGRTRNLSDTTMILIYEPQIYMPNAARNIRNGVHRAHSWDGQLAACTRGEREGNNCFPS